MVIRVPWPAYSGNDVVIPQTYRPEANCDISTFRGGVSALPLSADTPATRCLSRLSPLLVNSATACCPNGRSPVLAVPTRRPRRPPLWNRDAPTHPATFWDKLHAAGAAVLHRLDSASG